MPSGRTVASRFRSLHTAVLAVGLALLVGGCVDADGELSPDGALSLRYTYDPPTHATASSERARLSSPHVRLEKLERDQSLPGYAPGEFVTATLAVDDATRLSTAPAFAAVEVALDRVGRELRLTAPGVPQKARADIRSADDLDRRALRLSLVVPGPVERAAPAAAVDGRRVTWTLSLREYVALGDTATFTVSWRAGSPHSM